MRFRDVLKWCTSVPKLLQKHFHVQKQNRCGIKRVFPGVGTKRFPVDLFLVKGVGEGGGEFPTGGLGVVSPAWKSQTPRWDQILNWRSEDLCSSSVFPASLFGGAGRPQRRGRTLMHVLPAVHRYTQVQNLRIDGWVVSAHLEMLCETHHTLENARLLLWGSPRHKCCLVVVAAPLRRETPRECDLLLSFLLRLARTPPWTRSSERYGRVSLTVF